MLSRRKILQLIAGVPAMVLVPPARAAEAPLKRPIPKTGELLHAVGLGTWQTFDVGVDPDGRADAREVLARFVKAGGQMVDSSPMYGSSEAVVGDLAAALGVEKSLFLATKVWSSGREAGIRQMEESMRRMRTLTLNPRAMDLMQVHNLTDVKTQLKTLREWKEQGRIRYLGITHYHEGAYADLERLIKSEKLDFAQFNYNVVTTAAEERLLPVCAEYQTAVIVNRPFEQGELFRRVKGRDLPKWAEEFDCNSWARFFLKFILSHPAVTCAIPATRDPDYLVDNMGAALGRMPDAATRRRMARHMRSF
ncbi:MAG: aldo/keto reductase [Betaproteobacteria bacterium]|nr:aldo/keto reductase [Betaproteobacteria bacterium]